MALQDWKYRRIWGRTAWVPFCALNFQVRKAAQVFSIQKGSWRDGPCSSPRSDRGSSPWDAHDGPLRGCPGSSKNGYCKECPKEDDLPTEPVYRWKRASALTHSDLLRRLAPARASTREGNGSLALQMHIDTNHPRQEDLAPIRRWKEAQLKRI